jgi:hypothetical protein
VYVDPRAGIGRAVQADKRHHGFHKQMFGAKEQIFGPAQSD